jgi:hypothetical protein
MLRGITFTSRVYSGNPCEAADLFLKKVGIFVNYSSVLEYHTAVNNDCIHDWIVVGACWAGGGRLNADWWNRIIFRWITPCSGVIISIPNSICKIVMLWSPVISKIKAEVEIIPRTVNSEMKDRTRFSWLAMEWNGMRNIIWPYNRSVVFGKQAYAIQDAFAGEGYSNF